MPPNKTVYKRAMDHVRAEGRKVERRKKQPTFAEAKEDGKCGARTRSQKPCKMPAGWGTDHPGFGACKNHGGRMSNHRKAAAREQAVILGAPKEINPVDALLWCIHITAGEVEWIREQLAAMDKDGWYEDTVVGKQMHVLIRHHAETVNRLARYSKDAIALGIAERAVRIAEQYGASLAAFTRGLLEELELTPEQQKRAPQIVRKQLILLEQNRLVDPDSPTERLALPQARETAA